MNFICFNGEFYPADAPIINASNRSFKYGDGIFETMKVVHGKLPLLPLHFERLFLSLKLLQIHFSQKEMESELELKIFELCKRNSIMELARVRVAVYRNEKNEAEYLIEASPLEQEVNLWNEKGLVIDLFPYSRKSCDAYSNLKTANFLPYVLASLYAKEKGLDDAVVLNGINHIADTSKANLFLVKNNQFVTPGLHQGCVNGVMRRHLIDELKRSGSIVVQKEVSEKDLLDADEVFLTNAVFGLRWVQDFKGKKYENEISKTIYNESINPLWK